MSARTVEIVASLPSLDETIAGLGVDEDVDEESSSPAARADLSADPRLTISRYRSL